MTMAIDTAITIAVAVAFLVSLAGNGIYLKLARRWQLLDVPNHRSAHSQPTPRGGGVGIFAGLAAAMLALAWLGPGWPSPFPALTGLAALLLLAGLCDDRFNLPVALRLVLYAGACAAGLWLLLESAPAWLWLPALLYCLWILNLFNFMDGIDGIAATEAVFVLAGYGLLAAWGGTGGAFSLYCLLLAAACAAFLHWNWAPARMFMGDTGSIPLGFLLALLSLEANFRGYLPLSASLLLMAVFIADATYTLLWRALHGEKITQAHSRHLYQRLARHWGSHSRVVWAMLAYNLLWLLPLAASACRLPEYSVGWLAAGYLPLLPVLLKAGKLP